MKFHMFKIGIILLISFCIFASEYKPKEAYLCSQICIERPENNGSLNIRDVNVIIDNKQDVPLIGGQAVCIYVGIGEHFVYAESYDPYDPHSKNPKAWTSNTVKFYLKKGQRAELEITGGSKYQNKWYIKVMKKP
jgi:hypothetical protein